MRRWVKPDDIGLINQLINLLFSRTLVTLVFIPFVVCILLWHMVIKLKILSIYTTGKTTLKAINSMNNATFL